MAYLTTSTPLIYTNVNLQYLHDFTLERDEWQECVIFALHSVQGVALTFSVMMPNGAMYSGLPLHAFSSKQLPIGPIKPFHQMWNCFSYNVAIMQYRYLQGLHCSVRLVGNEEFEGKYLFTVDWCSSNPDEIDVTYTGIPQEKKCAHVIELTDSGALVAYPNNRIRWFEPSFCTDTTWPPKYKVNTRVWDAEEWVASARRAENSDQWAYKLEGE